MLSCLPPFPVLQVVGAEFWALSFELPVLFDPNPLCRVGEILRWIIFAAVWLSAEAGRLCALFGVCSIGLFGLGVD